MEKAKEIDNTSDKSDKTSINFKYDIGSECLETKVLNYLLPSFYHSIILKLLNANVFNPHL